MSQSHKIRKIIHFFSPLFLRAALGQLFRNYARWRRAEFIRIAVQMSKIMDEIPVIQSPPLKENQDYDFDILIPSSLNHIRSLEISLYSIRRAYGDNIKVNVLHQSSEQFEDLSKRQYFGNTSFIDEKMFSSEIQELENSFLRFGTARKTWLMQQCLKTLFIAQSRNPTVILDADTTLTMPLNFRPKSRDLLLIGSKEHSGFHMPYTDHISKFLNIQPIPVNFTHHCQLQRSDIVKEIYGVDVVLGLKRWLSLGIKYFEFSPVCEYQTYAEYFRTKNPSKTMFFSHEHHLVRVEKSDIENYSSSTKIQKHLNNECEGKCSLVTFVY